MNYITIKQLARDAGISYRDLIALAPQNDPFYVGTPGDMEKGRWFADIWRAAGFTSGVHLRRVHYWAVSQEPLIRLPNRITWNKKRRGTSTYINHDACWKYLCQASKLARYLGLVDIADVDDRKNPDPHVNACYNPEQELSYYVDTPNLDDWYVHVQGIADVDTQPYHLEVWCEKSTMDDVLRPVCGRYHANLVTFEGEVSVTACHNLVERIHESGGKPSRIFYISDFDPAGNSMPVAMSRKVEYLLQDAEYDVKIMSLVLTLPQVRQYRLPRTPIKESELRAGTFEDAFGAGATELDALEALHPGVLGQIVDDELGRYYSREAARYAEKKERDFRRAVKKKVDVITSQYAAELDAIRGMVAALEDVAVDSEPYRVKRFEPHVNNGVGDWLFDSGRDYVDQIGYYKAHKNNGRLL